MNYDQRKDNEKNGTDFLERTPIRPRNCRRGVDTVCQSIIRPDLCLLISFFFLWALAFFPRPVLTLLTVLVAIVCGM